MKMLKKRVYMSGEEAAWLADKIVAYGDYGNDAARMLRKLSTAEQQRDELLASLKDARSIMSLAFSAAEKKFNDEVLLHLGVGCARADKAIAKCEPESVKK